MLIHKMWIKIFFFYPSLIASKLSKYYLIQFKRHTNLANNLEVAYIMVHPLVYLFPKCTTNPSITSQTEITIIRFSSYQHIRRKKMWKKIITPPFQFDYLPTPVPKSRYRLKDSESAIIFAHFFGGLAPKDLFSQKKPNNLKFLV